MHQTNLYNTQNTINAIDASLPKCQNNKAVSYKLCMAFLTERYDTDLFLKIIAYSSESSKSRVRK
jgi:hypothetical protein